MGGERKLPDPGKVCAKFSDTVYTWNQPWGL